VRDSAVNPQRSAKRIVTCLRSSAGVSAAGGGCAARGGEDALAMAERLHPELLQVRIGQLREQRQVDVVRRERVCVLLEPQAEQPLLDIHVRRLHPMPDGVRRVAFRVRFRSLANCSKRRRMACADRRGERAGARRDHAGEYPV